MNLTHQSNAGDHEGILFADDIWGMYIFILWAI